MAVGRTLVLLGAGASVEAGVRTSNQLTEAIYNEVASKRGDESYARLLGFVISKLKVRNAKVGLSPYQPVEVEELFDALNTLFNRDALLVTQFVERWSDDVDTAFKSFDGHAIGAILKPLVKAIVAESSGARRTFSGIVSDNVYEDLARSLQPSNSSAADRRRLGDPQQPFFNALFRQLEINKNSISYLEQLVSSSSIRCLATLNYDLSVEMACENLNLLYDYRSFPVGRKKVSMFST